MRLNPKFLRSKVGRRMLAIFVSCALLPISALAYLAFRQVNTELRAQSRMRLHHAGKAQGMLIFQRLETIQEDLRQLESGLRQKGKQFSSAPEISPEGHFRSVVIVDDTGVRGTLLGSPENLPKAVFGKAGDPTGGPLLVTQRESSGPGRVFLVRPLESSVPGRRLIGEVNLEYLTGKETLPALARMCVATESGDVLLCEPAIPAAAQEQIIRHLKQESYGQFDWSDGDQAYEASYWTLFLKPRFRAPSWIVILSESKGDVYAPAASFARTFLLVALTTLLVVVLLSLTQIRRSLGPLEQLRAGTRRIALRDFDARVEVHSGDEFQELAGAFNAMAVRLGKQFHALMTINELDRTILSSLDTSRIVGTVLTWMRVLIPCDCTSVGLLEGEGKEVLRTYFAMEGERDMLMGTARLSAEEMQTLRNSREALIVKGELPQPGYLAPLVARGMRSFLVLPIFLDNELAGMVSVGHCEMVEYGKDDVVQARQVADQVAVALSNARLLEELAEVNQGTLIALARAIDAKSPWTAGHSERVTSLAVGIGRRMGLPPKELEILYRGGLLHDIGKIGTPPAVLDKAGMLDAREVALMREHVAVGARILEPIPGLADVIPIVLYHHEWFDGTGYPEGLAGNAIPLHARIFAVADCYDALASDRPYRRGLERSRVIHLIREKAGTQFDPRVVEAFLEVVGEDERGGSNMVSRLSEVSAT